MRKKTIIAAGAALAVAAGGAGVAKAVGGDDSSSVSGPQADRATAAALAVTGGGTANSVELDSENGATWEVEVTRPDRSTVDVRLDERFQLVVVEGDSEVADGNDRS